MSSSSTLVGDPSETSRENITPCFTKDTTSRQRPKELTEYHGIAVVGDNTTSDLPNTYRRAIIKRSWWLCEFMASILSLIGLGTLFGLLWSYDGKPQTAWNHRVLTLNGVVALLATVTRAALMVPVAEAISQAKWNWFALAKPSTKRKVEGQRLGDLEIFDAASRGAWGSLKLLWVIKGLDLATIGASVTVLSLAFNTLSQQLLSVEYRSTDFVDTNRTTGVQRSECYGHEHVRSSLTTTPHSMPDLAMVASIHSGILSKNHTDLQAYCGSGDCTWPVLPSLAVCGACTNVTDQIAKVPGKNDNGGYDTVNTFYQLPNGLILRPDGYTHFNVSQIYDPTHDIRLTSPGYSKDMVIAKYSALGAPMELPPEPKYFNAIECALWFCVQAWQISVTAAVQNRTVLATWALGIWDDRGEHFDFTNLPADFNVIPGTNFTVYEYPLRALRNAFNTFNGTNGGWYDLVDGLYESFASPHTWIQQVALSMTNALIQARPAVSDPFYAARITASIPYIRVRWRWFIFPVAMVLTSLFFFVTIAWQTRSRNVQAWKSSPFALLFCSVDENVKQESVVHVDEYDGLPARTENRRMLLKKDGNNGWMLTAA